MLLHGPVPLEERWVACGVEDRGSAVGVGVLGAAAGQVRDSPARGDVLAPVQLVVER